MRRAIQTSLHFLVVLGYCASAPAEVNVAEEENGTVAVKTTRDVTVQAAEIEVPIIAGSFKEVIPAHPEKKGGKGWYTNDHSFIEDRQGMLHWIGINNPFPPDGKELYRYHPYLGHCTTRSPMDEWTRQPWALDESEGTEYLGAPAIIWHDETQQYAMVFESFLNGSRRLEVAWSDDLMTWKRTFKPILPDKLWLTTRDPQIIKRPDNKYWIILTSHGAEGRKRSQVIRLTTRDFKTFQGPQEILGIDDVNWATLIESPFLVERESGWYLFFTYAHRRYAETIVVHSDNPDRFDFESDTVTTTFSHAAEIFTYRGREYISTCGPEDGQYLNRHGIGLAELKWLPLEAK